jgi:hypothetical protein
MKEEFRHAIRQPLRILVAAGTVPGVHPIDHAEECQRDRAETRGLTLRFAEDGLEDLLAAEIVSPLDLGHPQIVLTRQHPGLMRDDLIASTLLRKTRSD